jgi:hypothetical protein
MLHKACGISKAGSGQRKGAFILDLPRTTGTTELDFKHIGDIHLKICRFSSSTACARLVQSIRGDSSCNVPVDLEQSVPLFTFIASQLPSSAP